MADTLSYASLKAINKEQLLLPCDDFNFLPSVNTAKDARMDIVSLGLWDTLQASFMDVRVFHPNSPSYVNTPPHVLYKRHEAEKKRSYLRRVLDVEHGSFSPLVFSTTGGFGPELSRVIKRVATLISLRKGEVYGETVNAIRLRLRFSLLRSTLTALRGTRKRVNVSSLENTDFNL